MLCDAKEIALGVGHRCPLHVWVLVQHMPARGRAELLQASDLDSSLPPRDGQVKVHHLTISPATGGGAGRTWRDHPAGSEAGKRNPRSILDCTR
jgi:hypothetical protein